MGAAIETEHNDPRWRFSFIVNSLVRGGAERHSWDLASALRERGHEASIHMLRPDREIGSPDAELHVQCCGGSSIVNFRAQRRLAKALSDEQPDLIFAVNQRPMLYVYLARWFGLSRAPIVPVFHTTVITKLKDRLLTPAYTRMFNCSDHVVFVSGNQRAYWHARGIDTVASTAILNGIDIGRFNPTVRDEYRSQRRSDLGFSNSDFVVALVGAFRPEKNHRQLVDAVIALRSRSIPAKALFVGGGPEQDSVRAYAEQSGAAPYILFAGSHGDVRPFIAAADVGTLCSTSIETFSLAALEMMAMGLPVVLSDIGGASEMVRHGDNGFLFPAGDTNALIDALERLADGDTRTRMGAAAATRVAADFGYEAMVDRYEELAKQLLT